MITARSVTLALCLVSAPIVAAVPAAQAPAPQQQQVTMSKQDNQAAQNLNKYTKAALAASAASLVGGYALGNDVAMGVGLGGLGGVGTGLLQKNVHWLIAWIGESIVRGQIATRLCTKNPEDMEVSEDEINNPEWSLKLLFKNPALTYELKEEIVANRKAYGAIVDAGAYASWATYLAFRYLEKKAEQTA